MGLKIQTNLASAAVLKNLHRNTNSVQTSLERISSGYRINKSMDDVAGFAVSEHIQAQLRSSTQAQRNAQDAISFSSVAESGLSETSNILTRLRELSTQSASDTIGDDERELLEQEAEQLRFELDRIAETTEYIGTFLLNGSGDTLDFQIGVRATEENRISFDAGAADARTDALGVSDVSVLTQDDAIDSLEPLDLAIDEVNKMRARFGAIQSRLNSTISNMSAYRQSLTDAHSHVKDADIAEETVKLAKNTILQQAAISALAQSNTLNATALRLL